MTTEYEYEVYRELFRITAWRDGCIWTTQSLGCRWFPKRTIQANIPTESSLLFTAASDAFARDHMTTRIARPASGICEIDGYDERPDGSEMYWHCERPARSIARDENGTLLLCALHEQEYSHAVRLPDL